MEAAPNLHPLFTRIRVREEEDFCRLYPLILEYTDHPERAEHVTEVVFRVPLPTGYHYTEYSEDGQPREDVTDVSNETTMQRAVRHLKLPPEDEAKWVRSLSWMRPARVEVRRASVQADDFCSDYSISRWNRNRDFEFAHYATALLLTLCPNIETLVYEDDSPIVLEVLRLNNYGLFPKQYLQKLRHVHLLPSTEWPYGDERFYSHMDLLKLIRMFHRLPAIEGVRVEGIEPHGGADCETRFPPKVSNISKIHIGHNWIPGDVITALIQLPKQLEEFTCTTGGLATQDGGFYVRHVVDIGKALSQQKATLRILDLDIDESLTFQDINYSEDTEDDDPSGNPEERSWYNLDLEISPQSEEDSEAKDHGTTIGSLHDFSQLTHLSIGIETLLGPPTNLYHSNSAVRDPVDAPFRLIDALPPSLEYLLIRGYNRSKVERYDRHVEQLMSLRSDRLPNLQEVHGIDSSIPSGKSIQDPDGNMHLLWKPEPLDEDWKTTDGAQTGDQTQ